MENRLSGLQVAVLETLAQVEPRWTLVGGGALVGFHLHHRMTRDLDLFWRERRELADIGRTVEGCLRAAGFEVSVMRREAAFCRMTVSRGEERILVDLVAEPAGAVVEPEEREVGGRRVLVAGLRELLASKLCTLLNRAEPRDLVDVRAIIAKGVSFERALSDAPGIDSGFSALTLGWVLSELDLAPIAAHAGLSEEEAEELALFKDRLVDQLKRMARAELGEQET